MTEVQIILPEVSNDEVSHLMRALTRVLAKVKPDGIHPGCLGGWDGYGVDIETDVFRMFPYYWGDCTCGGNEDDRPCEPGCPLLIPNFEHKASGATVNWYKYIGRGMDVTAPPDFDWRACIRECIASARAADNGT